jgi:hypothetical protein
MEKLEKEEVELVACDARQLWLRRNKMVFGEELLPPIKVIQVAQTQVENFTNAEQRLNRVFPFTTMLAETNWKRPPEDFVKASWDAAIDTEWHHIGVGIVIRDHEGQTLAMKCMSRPLVIPKIVLANCTSRL